METLSIGKIYHVVLQQIAAFEDCSPFLEYFLQNCISYCVLWRPLLGALKKIIFMMKIEPLTCI